MLGINKRVITYLVTVVASVFVGASTAWATGIRSYRGFPVVKVVVNGTEVVTDVPAISIDGRTMLPVRAVAEALGAQVTWDEATQTVTISGKSTDADGNSSPQQATAAKGESLSPECAGLKMQFDTRRSQDLSKVMRELAARGVLGSGSSAAERSIAEVFTKWQAQWLQSPCGLKRMADSQGKISCERLLAERDGVRQDILSSLRAQLGESRLSPYAVQAIDQLWNPILVSAGCTSG